MSKFLVWDSSEKIEPTILKSYNVILWRSNDPYENSFSIPDYIEDNRNHLRNNFVKWVSDVGQISFKGKSIVEANPIRIDFSYWWLSEFSEMQHFGKESYIYDVFRLISLEIYLKTKSVTEILVITDKKIKTFDLLKEWAKEKKIIFKIQYLENCREIKYKIHNSGVLIIKAFVFLILHIYNRVINRTPLLKNISHESDLLFFDYFFNETNAEKTTFNSVYWTSLVQKLNSSKLKISWCHIWLKSDSPKSYDLRNVGLRINELNNRIEKFNNYHLLVNGQIGIMLLLRILKDYFKILKFSKCISSIESNFIYPNSDFNFFPFFINSFKNDYFGPQAMWNSICLNSFECLLKDAPKHGKAFYLQENTPWEICLVYAWKKRSKKMIIGVPHATIRFWDLRYFTYPSSFELTSLPKPQPDLIAVNSIHAKNNLIEGGVVESRIKEVEALRYLYLDNKKEEIGNNKNILLLGDYSYDNTLNMIKMVFNEKDYFTSKYKLVFKPHSGAESIPSTFGEINISHEPLSSLLDNFDLVIATNSTSSAVDAYCKQKKVIIIRDFDTFNMSPLLGFENVDFVSDHEELKNKIEVYFNIKGIEQKKHSFFYTSTELKNWQSLVEI